MEGIIIILGIMLVVSILLTIGSTLTKNDDFAIVGVFLTVIFVVLIIMVSTGG